MKNLLLKFFSILFLFTIISYSQSLPLPNGVKTHDGFYLKMIGGTGFAEYSADYKSETSTIKSVTYNGGSPFTFCFQIGGTIADNVIFFGESGGTLLYNPEFDISGEHAEESISVDNVYMLGIGPGLCYYFMPMNIYISGSILLAETELGYISGGGIIGGGHYIELSKQWGFGFNLSAGKEWWVGEQWSLGIGVSGFYCSTSDSYLSASSYSINLLFSVTYN